MTATNPISELVPEFVWFAISLIVPFAFFSLGCLKAYRELKHKAKILEVKA